MSKGTKITRNKRTLWRKELFVQHIDSTLGWLQIEDGSIVTGSDGVPSTSPRSIVNTTKPFGILKQLRVEHHLEPTK